LWRAAAESTAKRYWGWIPAPRRLKANNLDYRWTGHTETLIGVGLLSAEEARAVGDPAGIAP